MPRLSIHTTLEKTCYIAFTGRSKQMIVKFQSRPVKNFLFFLFLSIFHFYIYFIVGIEFLPLTTWAAINRSRWTGGLGAKENARRTLVDNNGKHRHTAHAYIINILPSKTLSDGNTRHTLDRQFISIVIIIARLPFYYGSIASNHSLPKADHNDQRVTDRTTTKNLNISARGWRISFRKLVDFIFLRWIWIFMNWVGQSELKSWRYFSLPRTPAFNFEY